MEFNIIGGNVAGVSTAFHLRKQYPEAEINIIERKVWNKPCGGAFSYEFYMYLNSLGIFLDEYSLLDEIVITSWNSQKKHKIYCPVVQTTRSDLQDKLIKFAYTIDINIQFKRVDIPRGLNVFNIPDQTIVASGYSSLTNFLLNRQWKKGDVANLVRFDGEIQADYPDSFIIIFDLRNMGYGWLFTRNNNVNVGYGALTSHSNTKKHFYELLEILNNRYNCNIPTNIKPVGCILPMPVSKNYSVSHTFNNNELTKEVTFVGVGDALGLAHPLLGAGIEPAWQSGGVLASCFDKTKMKFDIKMYARLLKKNLFMTSQQRLDRYFCRFLRSSCFRIFPFKDRMFQKWGWIVRHLFDSERPFFTVIEEG